MERIVALSDDDLRAELLSYGYHPPPIQDDITRKILRKKLALFIDPSLVTEEQNQNSNSSDDSEECNLYGDTSVRSRNRVRFSEAQENVYEVTNSPTYRVRLYLLLVFVLSLSLYLLLKAIDII
ncbi:unnamed protein product [Trichobilharzia szidati]|nr:unnamed protein product [Trichobilharzia szidati]CAH8857456.1 unnamed protein product [Trichobilharzia szidati]